MKQEPAPQLPARLRTLSRSSAGPLLCSHRPRWPDRRPGRGLRRPVRHCATSARTTITAAARTIPANAPTSQRPARLPRRASSQPAPPADNASRAAGPGNRSNRSTLTTAAAAALATSAACGRLLTTACTRRLSRFAGSSASGVPAKRRNDRANATPTKRNPEARSAIRPPTSVPPATALLRPSSRNTHRQQNVSASTTLIAPAESGASAQLTIACSARTECPFGSNQMLTSAASLSGRAASAAAGSSSGSGMIECVAAVNSRRSRDDFTNVRVARSGEHSATPIPIRSFCRPAGLVPGCPWTALPTPQTGVQLNTFVGGWPTVSRRCWPRPARRGLDMWGAGGDARPVVPETPALSSFAGNRNAVLGVLRAWPSCFPLSAPDHL